MKKVWNTAKASDQFFAQSVNIQSRNPRSDCLFQFFMNNGKSPAGFSHKCADFIDTDIFFTLLTP